MQRDIFNEIFHYTCCITLKRETSLRTYLCVIEPAGNIAIYEKNPLQWRAFGNNESDLPGPRFKPRIFLFRDVRITACSERDIAK